MSEDEDAVDDLGEPQVKRKNIESKLTTIKRNKNPRDQLLLELKSKERNRQRRHEELIDNRNRAVEVFSAKMDALLDKLSK